MAEHDADQVLHCKARCLQLRRQVTDRFCVVQPLDRLTDTTDTKDALVQPLQQKGLRWRLETVDASCGELPKGAVHQGRGRRRCHPDI